MTQPTALSTCRYWAFGPACPNIDSSGRTVCKFAHWDTGRLAAETNQRGTCKSWLQGTCGKGQSCWYEHRKTGVDGMNQGPIILTGFNLEVAAAAAGAGFNTWNHHALYNLIWAVKRVALRHCHGPVNPPPPRNPYYPDRYRPSGLGDNTSKKRPAPPSEPPTTSSLKLELKPTSLKPKFRAFKYTKSKKKLNSRAAPYQVDEIVNRAGTRDNPVNLLLDGEEDGPPGKKQKLDSSNANDVKPQHSGAQTHGDTSRLSGLNVLTNTQRETRGGSLTQQTGFVSVVDGDLNEQDRMTGIATLSSWPSPSVSLCRGFAPAQSVTPVTRQLKLVRHELEFAVESMISSRIIMKKVFDDHGDLLNLEETMPALTFLSKCLHVAETEAEKGVKHVDRVVKLISRE